jgi:hypothetical protein
VQAKKSLSHRLRSRNFGENPTTLGQCRCERQGPSCLVLLSYPSTIQNKIQQNPEA